MPIGFPAYTEKTVKLKGSLRKEILRAAMDSLDELGWHPLKDGKWCIRASVPFHFYLIFMIWGSKFTVEVEDERLFLRSEGLIPIEWLDLGQHSDNIKKFLDRFEDLLDEDH
jgi:hypothetical protein